MSRRRSSRRRRPSSVLETDIEKDGFEITFGELVSCIFDPARGVTFVAGLVERERERLPNRAIVVDDEDARELRHVRASAGMVAQKHVNPSRRS